MHNILPLNGPSNSSTLTACVQQLPSPITPPFLPSTASSPHASTAPRNLSRAATLTDLSSTDQARINAAPLKTFVHEVLRRSRTSCSVLQTALCYIEALRSKVPELVHQERTGEGIRGEVDQSERVVCSDDPRLLESPKEVSIDEIIDTGHLVGSENRFDDDAPATVRMLDDNSLTVPEQSGTDTEKKVRSHPEDLPTLPPLPSPLLCPRRTFLASLILASKFMQDKCYSNRAWAKLAGLPAREIGRCERALGEALGWRLWVGKVPAHRALPRSQSVGDLCSSRASHASASTDAFSTATGVVRRNNSLPDYPLSFSAMPTPPLSLTSTIPPSLQDSRMPTPEVDYSPTPTLNVSPAATDASSDSLGEERTVQMTFVDHVPDPGSLKTATPAIVPALAYAYAGEGGIMRAWNGFAWNGGGPGSGWIRGDAESLSVQY